MMSTPKGQEFAKKFAEHPDALEAARKVMEVLADTGGLPYADEASSQAEVA